MRKFKVIVFSSIEFGLSSHCVLELLKSPNIEISSIILSRGSACNKSLKFKRNLFKILKIGLLGALNGVRIRKWFLFEGSPSIIDVANKYNIPVNIVEVTNSNETRKFMKEANADLGLSIGNSYISQSVFSIPKHGMINIHSELLPRFQGAQSIIWPIYEEVLEIGFTIHCINKGIDTGDILYQKKYSIDFYPTLDETVRKNLSRIRADIPMAFVYVCEHFQSLLLKKNTQVKGRSYTTPTIFQFLKMQRNNAYYYRSRRD